jgi:hypothetical protein
MAQTFKRIHHWVNLNPDDGCVDKFYVIIINAGV